MKQGPSSPALSDQEIIRAWKWKRRAIYPCVAVGVVLLIAGFLLRENDTGMPLLVAGAIVGIAARELNTACRRCPRCGAIMVMRGRRAVCSSSACGYREEKETIKD